MPPLVYSYETAFDLFRGPTAPYAILLLIALPLLSLSVDRMRWWLLTAMFFIIPLDGMRLYVVDAALLHGSIDFGYHPLLEWLMRYSRPLFMLIILCMLLSALRFSRGWRTVLVGKKDRDTGKEVVCDAADAHVATLRELPSAMPELFA